MGSLKDLEGMINKGLLKIKEVQKKHKNPKVGQEVAEIAKQMGETILSEYHSFTSDQLKSFQSKADHIINGMKQANAEAQENIDDALKKVTAAANTVKAAPIVLETTVQEAINNVHEIMHAEKDRIGQEISNSVKVVKDRTETYGKQMGTIVNTMGDMIKEVDVKLDAFQKRYRDVQQEIMTYAEGIKNNVFNEINKKKEEMLEDTFKFFVDNLGKIILRWLKSFFIGRKKDG